MTTVECPTSWDLLRKDFLEDVDHHHRMRTVVHVFEMPSAMWNRHTEEAVMTWIHSGDVSLLCRVNPLYSVRPPYQRLNHVQLGGLLQAFAEAHCKNERKDYPATFGEIDRAVVAHSGLQIQT